MKCYKILLLLTMFSYSIFGQNASDYARYEVFQKEYVNYKGNVFVDRNSKYELEIQTLPANKYRATFLKGLSNSILHFEELSTSPKIKPDTSSGYVIFTIKKGGEVKLIEYADLSNSLIQLRKSNFPGLSDVDLEAKNDAIDQLLNDKILLQSRVLLDLNILYELLEEDIEENLEGVVSMDEDFAFKKMKNNRKPYFQSVDLNTLNLFTLYRTPVIDSITYEFDFLTFHKSMVSEHEPDILKIVEHFYDGSLDIKEHSGISLQRNYRKLHRQNNRAIGTKQQKIVNNEKYRIDRRFEIQLIE